MAGASSVVWVAGVAMVFFTQTVHADVSTSLSTPLARPLATLPPAPPLLLAPSQPAVPQLLRGMATWYGAQFHGRKTANGERFDMFALTACHPTLPFGTLVRVRNLRNKRSVVVRITDRGALFEGRVIDLSFAAAEKLEMTKAGVVPVALEVVGQESGRDSR